MKYINITIICFILVSCEKLVEIDVPDQKIISETVFSSDETANRAVLGIYHELLKAEFSSGGYGSVTLLGELTADNLQITNIDEEMSAFERNEIMAQNKYNFDLWSSAYNIIYLCNSVIEGLQKQNGVTEETKSKLTAEVQFVRAFVYFYLVNLYGSVPLIRTVNYQVNSLAPRVDEPAIYDAILHDLKSSIIILGDSYENNERTRPNKYSAMALLSRVYLYLKDWEKAEVYSTSVISSIENFQLLDNLDQVFLANSKEAIWQISPAGESLNYITNEARLFILTSPPPSSQNPVSFSNEFTSIFPTGDFRKQHWVDSLTTNEKTYYYPFKYKVKNSKNENIEEYSMVLRFAEQFLIRAEARANQENLIGSIKDLNKIRSRAHLELIPTSNSKIDKESILDSIQTERRRELFVEWGHRWLDLKRNDKASKILQPIKTYWQDTDILFPIPESDIEKNPNLTQNDGY